MNKQLNNLYQKITEWAITRGIDKQKPVDGYKKVEEECWEVTDAILADNAMELKDSIGDALVTILNFGNEISGSIIADVERGVERGQKMNLEHSLVLAGEELVHQRAAQTMKLNRDCGKIHKLLVRQRKDLTLEQQTHNNELMHKYLYKMSRELTAIARLYQMDVLDCLASAYDVIKDRTGKIVNGVFQKSADLKNGQDN